MAHVAGGERGERGRVREEKEWREGEAMGTPVLQSFEPRESVCLYLCLCNLWSSWALSQGQACSGAARRVTLRARHWSPWGPSGGIMQSRLWEGSSKWDWLAEPRRFRGHNLWSPQSN